MYQAWQLLEGTVGPSSIETDPLATSTACWSGLSADGGRRGYASKRIRADFEKLNPIRCHVGRKRCVLEAEDDPFGFGVSWWTHVAVEPCMAQEWFFVSWSNVSS